MSNLFLNLGILLAQAEAAGDAADANEVPRSIFQQIVGSPFTMFIILGFLFYIMILKPQQRQRHQARAMMDNMKVNDRVVTIGGIQGTIVSINDQDITIRVDESNNTKLKMTRPYIARVVMPDDEKSKAESKS